MLVNPDQAKCGYTIKLEPGEKTEHLIPKKIDVKMCLHLHSVRLKSVSYLLWAVCSTSDISRAFAYTSSSAAQ